jgi:hypothetical protein
MNTRQAKDFLVEQASEQASLENIPLSDIEKRMMYFTESDPSSCDQPLELNQEFEAQCDGAKYEVKMSRLLHHAYERLKNSQPEKFRDWNEAIKELKRGDHYLLVLWNQKLSDEHPIRSLFMYIAIGIAIVIGLLLISLWTGKR